MWLRLFESLASQQTSVHHYSAGIAAPDSSASASTSSTSSSGDNDREESAGDSNDNKVKGE